MTIYTVMRHSIFNFDIDATVSFKERGDAEEFVLACAQEDEVNYFNDDIQNLSFPFDEPTGENVLARWITSAKAMGRSLESYSLFRASDRFIVRNELK